MLQRERFVPAIRIFPRPAARRKILVVNGHPDPRPERFCAALCLAYEEGAQAGGWEVRRLNVGLLSCDVGEDGEDLDIACQAIAWATQLTVIFPLWLGRTPPALRGLFEEISRRAESARNPPCERPARSVITMEMPAFAHRALLQRNILRPELETNVALPGFTRQERDFIGSVAAISQTQRCDWLATLRRYGVDGR